MIHFGANQPVKPEDQDDIILGQLREGKLLPIISNRLHNRLLFGDEREFNEIYASQVTHKLAAPGSVAEIAQFNSVMIDRRGAATQVKRHYLEVAKSWLFHKASEGGEIPASLLEEIRAEFDQLDFSAIARRLECPLFGPPDEDPLMILANWDLPIYITTSFHRFIEQALEEAGKQPRTVVCPWSRSTTDLPEAYRLEYEPSAREPLVYHLFGLDNEPDSMVLTEDDYLEFLVNTSRQALIPSRLREALTLSSVLMLDYNPGSWDFRALLWGLIKRRSVTRQSVCLLQSQKGDDEDYLKKYLMEVDFEVHQGDFDAYIQQLNRKKLRA